MSGHFSSELTARDPLIATALADELERQQTRIELIASENIVSRAVLDALGHPITNKTLEGYPGKRFHGGGEFVDVVESAAIERARELFGCGYANVQPHSGSQANLAVFFATLAPGDRVLSMDLAAGGHLSHGAAPNLSGRWFDAQHYGVDRDSGLIDYAAVESLARDFEPRLLIAGGSAYPRAIDFARLRAIADACGALLLVDMAHFAGLVAAGAHPSPLPHADLVTCTTTKTLRGPRGGLILASDSTWANRLDPAVFPGVQGSLHSQVIAAKAVCLGEALAGHGLKLVGGGSDTHLLLLDVEPPGLRGQQVQDALARVGVTSNKNPVPFDSRKPSEWRGLRLGVAAATTRGLDADAFAELGDIIGRTIAGAAADAADKVFVKLSARLRALCARYPIYS